MVRMFRRLFALLASLCLLQFVLAQDLEPRRWTALPLGTKVFGAGYGHLNGDIYFDPIQKVEDATLNVESIGVSYVQSFSVMQKLARFDMKIPWQTATWEGLLDGKETKISRTGVADPRVRLSIILYGAPAVNGQEMREYFKKRGKSSNTIVGAAVSLNLPWGEYFEDKLLNLGQNRYTVRPQVGIVHTHGKWSYELTGSTFLYSDNDEFFGGLLREQDHLYALQGHIIRTFGRGVWASLSSGYAWGGASTIDRAGSDDERDDLLTAVSFGFPVSEKQGIKIVYLRGRTKKDIGADTDTFAASWSVRF